MSGVSPRQGSETTENVPQIASRSAPPRFADDRLYVGGRYNTVNGQLAGIANDVTVERAQIGGGWYVTPNVLTKLEFVRQNYESFPSSDIRSGGKFEGFVVEGVVAF